MPQTRQDHGSVITILFLAANPIDTPRLRLEEEIRAIDLRLRLAEHRDAFSLRPHVALRVGDLQELLLRHQPDIVHFSGHGSSTGEIYLQDDSGRACPVPAAALRELFSLFADHVRCVVLNGCFSWVQGEAIADVIDSVVGMSQEISDQAAVIFSASFYQALAYGRSVHQAFALSRNQVHLNHPGQQDIPQLLARRADPVHLIFLTSKAQRADAGRGQSPLGAKPGAGKPPAAGPVPGTSGLAEPTSPPAPIPVFLSYGAQDEEQVLQLYDRLAAAGFVPWMDRRDLLPGQKARTVIQQALRQARFVLICLSSRSLNQRGPLQRDMRAALEISQEMPERHIYLIPVRLEPCDLPEALHEWHAVDLFAQGGWDLLLAALGTGATDWATD